MKKRNLRKRNTHRSEFAPDILFRHPKDTLYMIAILFAAVVIGLFLGVGSSNHHH